MEKTMATNGQDSTERDVIPARKAKELVQAFKNAGANRLKINEAIGREINSAILRYGITRKVLTLIAKLDGLEAERLADWKDEFDHWWDVLGLEKRAESAPRFEELSHHEEDQPSAA
jgi:hypothetical protein